MALSYQQPGLVLKLGSTAAGNPQVRALQHDLRCLGYLKRGIDGAFGLGTERAVKALQYDLIHNDGHGTDGIAPVAVRDFNKGRVAAVTGELDQSLAACLSDILTEPRFVQLPSVADPRAENARIAAVLKTLPSSVVPIPFLIAILIQESGLKHYNEPKPGDDDTFITAGLDTNAGADHIITSRGYGAGQYTLFHHPARLEEVNSFMLDPEKNVQRAVLELREKFDRFVNGPADTADDRLTTRTGPLKICDFAPGSSQYLKDCKQCLLNAGKQTISAGVTPTYPGSNTLFESTQYYDMNADEQVYKDVPLPSGVPCDWPYAARRYNGSGLNSYHYQVRILKHLLAL